MANLAGTNAPEDLLKVKWLSLLPQNMRNILKIFKVGSTQELLDVDGTIADSLMSRDTESLIRVVGDKRIVISTHCCFERDSDTRQRVQEQFAGSDRSSDLDRPRRGNARLQEYHEI